MSKHGVIIDYISSLKVGTRISVRGIASALNVSEGTAYRAIKKCRELGIVTTISRVGTVRVDKVDKKNVECLTYAQVINIVDGSILGGDKGIYKTLDRFFIAAMKEDEAVKFFKEGSLVIVGNRDEIQKLALNKNCGVLISGGFKCSKEVKALADQKNLPIISSNYDTFTIASKINRAISENMIKKEIVLVEDIMKTDFKYFRVNDKVKTLKELFKANGYELYPILNSKDKFLGNVYAQDILIKDDNDLIEQNLIKDTTSISSKATAFYAAHIMLSENINVCAVVDKKRLVGIIQKSDAMSTIKYVSLQTRINKKGVDSIIDNFEYEQFMDGRMHFYGKILPQMIDVFGNASSGVLNMIISACAIANITHKNNSNVFVDNITTYFIEPVQVNSSIDIFTQIIDKTKNSCKVEVNIRNKSKHIICKSLVSARMFT